MKVERYGPPHFEKDGFVSLWVAIVPLSKISDDYFEERSGDEEVPLTKFYGDFGFGYFDHDFIDTNGTKLRDRSIEKLLAPCSYSASFAAAAVKKAQELGLEKTQWVVLLYDFAYDPQQTKITQSSCMRFVGSFSYEK